MKNGGMGRVLRAVNSYLIFFMLVAFVVTCCTMLFVTTLSEALDITLTNESVGTAAKLTLVNVILVSAIFTAIDALRRKWTVERPVKRITAATERMMAGDFSAKIPPRNSLGLNEGFNEIIDCINKMADELSGVETLRTDFIANVSHEMKTPLAVIQNYSRLLESEDISEEKRVEYAKAIGSASHRLTDMMTNILKLNRLENQSIYPKMEEYELGEQLCECLLQYEDVWEENGIELQTDISEGIVVCADRELLSLVWNNLFSNAFKFTERGGCVSLFLASDDGHAVVRVKDTGCGMSSEVGAHIFEKFYQGDSSRATQGNGLGLALVKRVVDILGAQIEVESEPSVGTTFTVRIKEICRE